MKLWIAIDNYGFLGLYKEYPTEAKRHEFGGFIASLPKNLFPEVTFENSPQEVELKLVNEL